MPEEQAERIVHNLGLPGSFFAKWTTAYADTLPNGQRAALFVTPSVKAIVDLITE